MFLGIEIFCYIYCTLTYYMQTHSFSVHQRLNEMTCLGVASQVRLKQLDFIFKDCFDLPTLTWSCEVYLPYKEQHGEAGKCEKPKECGRRVPSFL